MATAAQHRARWRRNRAFVGTIGDDYPEWMVVAMFYAALHAVETLFAHDGIHVHGGHTARNQTLKRHNRYKQVWRNYLPLYDAARTARYEVEGEAWIAVQDVRNKLAAHFYRLEGSILKLTGESDRLPGLWE